MGMYDELRLPTKMLPLNAGELQLFKEIHTFQTKAFDCLLDLLEITEGGILLISRCRPASESEIIEILENYSGEFNFYSDIGKRWFEFTAYFKNGKLQKIDRDYDSEKLYNRLGKIGE